MDHGFEFEKVTGDAEGIRSPILDDITAEDQYACHVGKSCDESPEKRLMLAILSDAISCVRQRRRSGEFAEALDWILDEDPDRLCSFDNVCETLGLEPSSVRRKVLETVAWSSSVAIPVLVRSRQRKIPIRVAA